MITNLNDFRKTINEGRFGGISSGFTYKGHTYKPFDDCDDDVCKIYHIVEVSGEKDKDMDWSPYSTPTQEDFELWVDLGTPDRYHAGLNYEGRSTFGPLDKEDLDTIKKFIETGNPA